MAFDKQRYYCWRCHTLRRGKPVNEVASGGAGMSVPDMCAECKEIEARIYPPRELPEVVLRERPRRSGLWA